MEYLFAPMEGITLSIYRKIHHKMFPGCSCYYTPFIAPDSNGGFKTKYLKDITFDSSDVPLVPQLLVNNAAAFHATALKLNDIGFKEINLNLGCPSGTVFAKGKGAGLLQNPESLDEMLDAIFNLAEKTGYRVSVKTRMGVHSTGEFDRLLFIYQKYPLARLIVHARAREDFYKGKADMEGYASALKNYNGKVTYNGDIFCQGRIERLHRIAPETDSVMIGRGAVANPALMRCLNGGAKLQSTELNDFHSLLIESWLSYGLSPRFTVERMKNYMVYMMEMFHAESKLKKMVFKAKTLDAYRTAVRDFFCHADFDSDALEKVEDEFPS